MNPFSAASAHRLIAPTDPIVTLEGTPTVERLESCARFRRLLRDLGESGFMADAPGGRIRFKTDAVHFAALLRFTGEHKRTDALNSVLVLRIDGEPVRPCGLPQSRPGLVRVEADFVQSRQMRSVEILLPYGDSVEYLGLEIDDRAALEPWPLPTGPRWVAYGDSITHGFGASNITKTYPFLVGEIKGWQVVNFGVGSRQAAAEDANVLAAQEADIFTIMVGFNDYYHQKPPNNFATDLGFIVDAILDRQLTAEVCVITPLWSSSQPFVPDLRYTLAEYRTAARRVVDVRSSPRLHSIDGLELVPADPAFFTDGIHPNDRGFAELAQNLASLMPDLRPAT